MIDKNRTLPVMDILYLSFKNIIAKIKTVFILSYLIALIVYLFTLFLPGPTNLPEEAGLFARISYIGLFLSLVLIISIVFYRLWTLDIKSYKDYVPSKLVAVIFKMIMYLAGLFFLLFIAELAVFLLFLLITAIVNNIGDAPIINEAHIGPVVYFTMLMVTLLIVMRLQPTFISVATNNEHIPMKSSYYYTRDNNKELIMIGLFTFLPALMPIMITFYAFTGDNGSASTGALLTFLVFPLFLLPYLMVLSAGVEVYKYLVPSQNISEIEI